MNTFIFCVLITVCCLAGCKNVNDYPPRCGLFAEEYAKECYNQFCKQKGHCTKETFGQYSVCFALFFSLEGCVVQEGGQ